MCIDYLKNKQLAMPPLRGEKLNRHRVANECCICHNPRRPFIDGHPDWRKVADHDHITGYYLGAAHDLCNRNRRVCFEIPVFFHNFRGYDGHIIVKSFSEHKDREIKIIGHSMEKYVQVKWGPNLSFRDSLQILKASLLQLTESFKKAGGNARFKHLDAVIQSIYGKKMGLDPEFDLLLRKGVFPYEYLDSIEKFHAEALPPIEQFHSSLREEDITEEEYEHAKNVCRSFNFKRFEEYLKLYLTTDVAQLADVFDDFRNTGEEGYRIDPAYCLSLPQFAWNAMLKKTNVEIELISDPEMYRKVQANIRGGICHASVRRAIANNKYMGGLFNKNEPSTYIFYFDIRNLYGWAMTQELPLSDFQWLSDEEVRDAHHALASDQKAIRDAWFKPRNRGARFIQAMDDFDAGVIDAHEANKHLENLVNLKQGYFLEVDLDYPEKHHDRDNEYPLAPELMEITADMHSEKHLELIRKYFGSAAPWSKKLICSLYPKQTYLVLGDLLEFYLNRGLKLVKVHSGIKFTTSKWIEPYIQYNTEQRHRFKDDETKKAFFKAMNLSVYGKTIENPAKRSDYRLFTDMNKARQMAEKPHCIDFRVFTPELIGLEMRKQSALINKPFQLGFAILEWSKLLMYRAYATLKDHFGPRMHMMYTDTDSMIVHLQSDDAYEELRDSPDLRALFDFSENPVNHPCKG